MSTRSAGPIRKAEIFQAYKKQRGAPASQQRNEELLEAMSIRCASMHLDLTPYGIGRITQRWQRATQRVERRMRAEEAVGSDTHSLGLVAARICTHPNASQHVIEQRF